MSPLWIVTPIFLAILMAARAPVTIPPLSTATKPVSEPSPVPVEKAVSTEAIVSTNPTPGQIIPPPAPENPYLPRPGDERLSRRNAYIDSAKLLTREGNPPQIALILRGNLPTPCNQLRVIIKPPDEQNRINVDVYSLIDSNKMCTQVLSPFRANIPLGNFAPGHYTVWVNEIKAGEFDW